MKIKNLKINGFGNIKNKEIKLNNGINIIYGKNESGKSTLLKFIYCMLYGASKNKNGKDISDFEKYMPWDNGEYSGKIEYELDNNKTYEVFREFEKKNPKIFNEKLEDVSKEFNSNKTKGIEFFYEQTKIDEELFKNTLLVEQGETRLEKSSQKSLIQKITNLLSTGSDNISYKSAIEKINKRIVEEVGTERTSGRPINLVEEKIEAIENKKRNIEKNKEEIELLEKEKIKNNSEIEKEENTFNLLKEIKANKEKENIEIEKIKTNEQLKKELEGKIETLNSEIKEEKIEKHNNIIKYLLIAFLGLFICAAGVLLNNYYIFIGLVIPAVLLVFILIKQKSDNNKKIKSIQEENNKIKSQINIIKENINEIENKINNLLKNINEENEKNSFKIKNDFLNKVQLYEIENILNKNYDDIQELIKNEENKISNLKIKQNTLIIEKNNLEKNEENAEQLEVLLNEAKQEKQDLLSLEKSLKIAKTALEKAYERAKQSITPEFMNKLQECINKISDGKYGKVSFNDENGLTIEIPNGDYVSVESLSMGTIDQMYLSLRISSISQIVEEKLPIILDEAFAYYDDNRLKNILRYINNEYSDNQIIIFTCSNREETVLKSESIEFNKIEI